MNLALKLTVISILTNFTNFNLISLRHYRQNSLMVLLSRNNSYLLFLHCKLSSLLYSLQLNEMFSYEIPSSASTYAKNCQFETTDILVHNLFLLYSQNRLSVFSLNLKLDTNMSINTLGASITELFMNANWLERELGEMTGQCFVGKKDSRNLLLMYGDVSAPMRKQFPSIGTREIFYDSTIDSVVQAPVSLQF